MLPAKQSKIHPIYRRTSELTGERVLVLAPHPDDETFGCGGSMALHRQAGDDVRVIVITDGGQGDFLNTHEDKCEYIRLREREVLAAMAILSVHDVHFLKFEDQQLQKDFQAVATRIVELAREFEPTLLYAPAQTEHHIDHKTTNEILWHALRELPTVQCIALYEVDPPTTINCSVDITAVVALKEKACDAFESQNSVFAYGEGALALNRLRASRCHPQVTHVEAFYFLSINK